MKRLSSLQYISDIHLEHKSNFPKIQPIENNLALLGDIGNPFKDNYKEFLKYTSNKWEHIFLLTGNHEYWHEKYNMDDVDNKIKDLVSVFPNITFLNNNKYEFSNCTILGTTLWSQINDVPKRKIGDDLYIHRNSQSITYKGLNLLHYNSVNWLKKKLKEEKSHKNVVVLTHHLPSYSLIVDKYRKGYYKLYHDRFASHLDYMIKPPIRAWLCGHSHSVNEVNINGVHCAINAYGYFNLTDRTEKSYLFNL